MPSWCRSQQEHWGTQKAKQGAQPTMWVTRRLSGASRAARCLLWAFLEDKGLASLLLGQALCIPPWVAWATLSTLASL